MRLLVLLIACSLVHAQLEFDGKQVSLTPEGNIGRIYTEKDVPKEIEKLLAQPAPKEQNVWVNRVFILRRTDTDWEDSEGKLRHTKAEMTDADVEGLKKAIEQFARCVEAYTGRRLRFDLEVRVIDEPLVKVSGGKGEHLAFGDATEPLIGRFVEEGKVDSVMVFWIPKDIQLGIYWGGTVGGSYKGAGYSSIAYVHPGNCDVQAYFEVALHEWLHQAEWARSEKLGYSDLPDLHMATQMGYVADGVSRGWMDWYRDFMGTYFTPRMWRVISERRGDPDRPHPTGEGGYCREWLALGPFPNDADAGIDKAFIDEGAVRPDEKEEAAGKKWTLAKSGDDVLDFFSVFGPHENAVGYLHAYIDVGVEGPVRLWVGSDDGEYTWWNGRRVMQHHIHRGCTKDKDYVDVLARKGWNRLLLKVDQGVGAWAACARLTDLQGKPLSPTWRASRPAKGLAPDDEDPLLAKDWHPKAYKWEEISDDPWRLLPEWHEAELRRATGHPDLKIMGGESFILLGYAEGVEPPLIRGDPSESTLGDNELNLAKEAVSPAGGMLYFLVRPDAAALLASRHSYPSVSFVGWTQYQRRAVLVATIGCQYFGALNELGLLLYRNGSMELETHFRGFREGLIGGERAEAEVVLRNRSDKAIPLDSIDLIVKGPLTATIEDGAIPLSVPAQSTIELHWCVQAPAEVMKREPCLLVAHFRSGSIEGRDVKAIELRESWQVSLETKDGRPVGRAMRGKAHPIVVRVKSNMGVAVKGDLSVVAPEGWLAGGAQTRAIALDKAGEATFDIPIALPATWDGVAEVRVTATPDEESKKAGVHERSVSLKLECLPWTIVGPFSNRDRVGFATQYAPEKTSDWTQPMDGVAGQVYAFDVGPPGLVTAGHANLLPLFEPHEWVVAYARIRVTSPEERKAQLRLGSDDTVTAWWNSEQVVAHDVYRPAAPDQEVVPVTLRKGDNDLVLKIGQGGGDWQFFFRLTDPDGKPIEGLRYSSR